MTTTKTLFWVNLALTVINFVGFLTSSGVNSGVYGLFTIVSVGATYATYRLLQEQKQGRHL